MKALFKGLSVCKPTTFSKSFISSSIYPGPYAVSPLTTLVSHSKTPPLALSSFCNFWSFPQSLLVASVGSAKNDSSPS